MKIADFYPTAINDDNFIRGAARFLWAGVTVAFPAKISDVINASTYAAQSGWNDLGATKTGMTITINNTEETFDVDQIFGIIDSRPTGWECTIGTSLAEMTLAHFQFAWEGAPVQSVSGGLQNEQMTAMGNPQYFTQRRLAVLHQKVNGNIRAFCFRKVTRAPVAIPLLYSKTGEQQTLPVQFQCLADTSITDVLQRFFVVYDQTLPGN